MAPDQEHFDHVDRMVQHIREVEEGIIPEDSPPDFIRSDWKQYENGLPGWYPPGFKVPEKTIEAVDKADQKARRNPLDVLKRLGAKLVSSESRHVA